MTKSVTVRMPRNPGAAAMVAEALGGIPGVEMVDSRAASMQPRVDVNRYDNHIDVLVNGVCVAQRIEDTGKVTWFSMDGFNDSDRAVIERDVLAKVPRLSALGPANRAQRRHLARAKRRAAKKK